MRHSTRYSRLLKFSAVGLAIAGIAAPAATAYPVDPDPGGQPAWKNRVVVVQTAVKPRHVKLTTRTTQRPCPHSKAGCLLAP
jgi:hypothetical protein